MKFNITIIALGLMAALALSCSQGSTAQKTDKYKIVSGKLASKNFIFVANSLTPMQGQLRILTSPYDVRVTPDSVISYLPYFGNAQQAPVSSADAGIIFTSTDFEYNVKDGKKRSFDLEIKFKDQTNTQRFNFIIYDDGSASLNVLSVYRDPISFRGYIKLQDNDHK
jgi:hypothetical protein